MVESSMSPQSQAGDDSDRSIDRWTLSTASRTLLNQFANPNPTTPTVAVALDAAAAAPTRPRGGRRDRQLALRLEQQGPQTVPQVGKDPPPERHVGCCC